MNKVKQWAREGGCDLYYVDEAGFFGSPPVQSAWSPVGKPHEIWPAPHQRVNVLGLLDFGAQTLHHQQVSACINRPIVERFLDEFICSRTHPIRPGFLVLDNASIHHNLDPALITKWMCQHKTFVFYLPTYSPELNMIETVWKHAKYHWRDFMTWAKDELVEKVGRLLSGFGSKFKIDFG